MSGDTTSRVIWFRTDVDPTGIREAGKEINKALVALSKDVAKHMQNIQASVNGAVTSINGLNNAINNANTSVKSASTQMTASLSTFSATSKDAAKNIKDVNSSVGSLSTKLKTLTPNAQSAASAIDAFKNSSQGVGSFAVNITSVTKAMSGAATGAGSMSTAVKSNFGDMTDRLRMFKYEIMDIGRMFIMTAGTIAAAVGVPVKAFGDFQKEMLTLKNIASDFSARELKQFEQTVMAVASANGIMATEIAKSGVELVRLGLSASEVNLVLGQVADAALANSISIVKAAEIGLGTTKAMGLEVKDLSKVLDVLTRAAVTSATDVEGLGITFKYAAPIFRAAGQDIKQLGVASVILANNMVRNSQAGTTLRSMMVSLQKPTKEAKEQLQSLGIEIADKNTKAMKPFMQIVQELSAAMDGMSVTSKNAALAMIFGKYALSGASALINSTTAEVNKAAAGMDNMALSNKKMADGMREGINFQLDQLKANFGNAAIAIGSSFAPAVSGLLKTVSEFGKALSELPSFTRDFIAELTVSGAQITLWVAGIGLGILAVSSLIRLLQGLGGIILSTVIPAFVNLAQTFTFAVFEVQTMIGSLGGAGLAAGGLGTTIAATGIVVATFAAGIAALIAVLYTLKELWGAITASIAEEKAWEIAAQAQANYTERVKEGNKQLREAIANQKRLNDVRAGGTGEGDYTVAPETPQTPTQLRQAAYTAGRQGNKKQQEELKRLANARDKFDKANADVQSLSTALQQYGENDPQRKQIKTLMDEKIKAMKTEYKLLRDSNQLTKTEIFQREGQIKSAEDSARIKKAEAVATGQAVKVRQQNTDAMSKINARLSEIDRKIEEEFQQERKNAPQTGGGLQGVIAETAINFTKSTKEAVAFERAASKIGPTCASLVKHLLKLSGVTENFTKDLGFSGSYVYDWTDKLLKAGMAVKVAFKDIQAGDLAVFEKRPTEGHIGIGIGGGQFVHSSGVAGRRSGYGINQLAAISGPYKAFTGRGGQTFGLRLTDKAFTDDAKQRVARGEISAGLRDIKSRIITRYIGQLEEERKLYKQGTDEYEAYTKKIQELRNKAADAENDAEQKRVEARKEALRQMEEMHLQTEEKILSIEQDMINKRAKMNHEELKVALEALEKQTEREKEEIVKKYGNHIEHLKLLEDADRLSAKTREKIIFDNEMRLTEIVKQQERERAKERMSANQKTLYDLQKEREALEAELANLPAKKEPAKPTAAPTPPKKELTADEKVTALAEKINEERFKRNELIRAQDALKNNKTLPAYQVGQYQNYYDEEIKKRNKYLEELRTQYDKEQKILSDSLAAAKKQKEDADKKEKERRAKLTQKQREEEDKQRAKKAEEDKKALAEEKKQQEKEAELAARQAKKQQEEDDKKNKQLDKTRELLNAQIAEKKRLEAIQQKFIKYDQMLSAQDEKRYKQQQDLVNLQNLVSLGLASQNELNVAKISINNKIIADAEKELKYIDEVLKASLTQEEYTNKVRAATEKLNKAKQDNLDIDKESLKTQLEIIGGDVKSGKISQDEALQKSIDSYNEELNRLRVSGQTGGPDYNATLAARNELMLKSAVISQDFTKILEAQIRNLYGVEQASQATIFSFGDMKLNGEQLIKALPDLSDAFSKLGSSVSKGNEALGKAINALGVIGSVTMKFLSGNPALMIAGIVEAIAFMTDVFTDIIPTQEQVDERNLELARSLAEVEQKARDAATQIAYLRGEISKYDKESRDRESQRKKMGDDLTNLQKEESNLANNFENIQKGYLGGLDLSQNALGSILSAFASKDAEEKLKNVRKQITELTSDIQVFDAETEKISQKSPIEQAIAGNEEYIKQLELNAQATFSLYDDAVAAEMKKISDLASAHQTELENAIDNGLNIEEVQQRHNQEMKNLMDENLRNRQKAIDDEKQMLLDAQIELQQVLTKGTGTKKDDILLQAYADKATIIAKFKSRMETIKGLTPIEIALMVTWRQQLNEELAQIDKNALNDIAANEREKQKFNRETTMLEIENSGDSYKIFRQSIEDKMADLDDWKAAQIAAGEDAVDIERRYQAQRIEIQRKAADEARQFATQQMSELKNIRKEILDTQSLRYEQEILQQERFLLDLNKQRDDLQRQIDWYDNQIAKLKGTFNEADKNMFKNLLANVDIPAEVRKGLELIANPTDVPNNRFSRDSQRKAIQEQVEMLTLANKNLLDLEERSTVDYWKEESRIALIQGAAANEMLTDTTIATKLTAKEKLEIQKDLADAYKRFQEAEIRMIEEKYQAEKNAADKQLLDMKIKEADRNTIIANNKYQLDLLKQKYDQDINTIDTAVNKLNDSHKGLVFSLSEVERKLGNMNPIIEKITSSYKNLSSTINSIGSSSGTGISGTSVNTSTYSPYQTSTHTVQGNKGWYTNTSDMIAAESLGLKDGGIIGMIPNQDKYKGDKFPIMPGVNGNAGELLVSPLERLSEIMPTSNNFSVMVTGNVFKNDVDFERVMKSVFKEQNLRSNMSSGQFYSNLRR